MKKYLIFSGVGDSSDEFLSWCTHKSDIYDRAIFYYGDDKEKYNKLQDLDTEYIYKSKGMIWQNFAKKYNFFKDKDYDYVLLVDSDLDLNYKDLEDTFKIAHSNNWSMCQWSRDPAGYGFFNDLYSNNKGKYSKTNYIENLFVLIRKDFLELSVKKWNELNLEWSTGADFIIANVGLNNKMLPYYILNDYTFYNPHPHDKKNGREIDVVTNTNYFQRTEKLRKIMSDDPKYYRINNVIQCDNKKIFR